MVYCNFKSFINDYFEDELFLKLDHRNKLYTIFKDNLVDVLNKHVTKTRKNFLGNDKPHLSQSLQLVIMKRSYLNNEANKIQLPGYKLDQKTTKVCH